MFPVPDNWCYGDLRGDWEEMSHSQGLRLAAGPLNSIPFTTLVGLKPSIQVILGVARDIEKMQKYYLLDL